MDNKELKVIADAMLEKKGQDVVSLDLRSIGTATLLQVSLLTARVKAIPAFSDEARVLSRI